MLRFAAAVFVTLVLAVMLVIGKAATTVAGLWEAWPQGKIEGRAAAALLQRDSLCAKSEQIVFSCRVKGAGKGSAKTPAPTRIVSLCASPDLDREHGYLQYRFGLPAKIELEFPKSRESTQQLFTYKHYFRFQVDLTEIGFNIEGYEYTVFDNYNGEEKPSTSWQGVSVTAPGKPKEVTLSCLTKPKADFSIIADVLNRDQE